MEGSWISPEGVVYDVKYGKHRERAERIVALIYKEIGSVDFLEKRGWLYVCSNGSFWTRRLKITEPQLDAFYRLLKLCDDEQKENMETGLELWLDEKDA